MTRTRAPSPTLSRMRSLRRAVVSGLVCSALALVTAAGCGRPDGSSTAPGAPTSGSPSVADAEPWRATPPSLGPTPPLVIPTPERFTAQGGLDALLMRDTTLPLVTVVLAFPIGSADEPARAAGRTSLCVDLLDEGTKAKDQQAFSAALADRAVNLYASGGTHTTYVVLTALREELDAGLALMAEMLRTPGLRKADLERLRREALIRVDDRRKDPGSVAGVVAYSLMFGREHPYGSVTTRESLSAIKPADCAAFAKRLVPGGARLLVAGDTDRATIEAGLARHFKGWKGTMAAPAAPPAPQLAAGALHFVDIPGTTQASIYVGQVVPGRTDPSYPALRAVAEVLGGSIGSRLNQNLREEKGWSYGAFAFLDQDLLASAMIVGTSVQIDKAGPSVREVAKEVLELASARPPTEVEFERYRTGAIRGLPASYASARGTLFRIAGFERQGLAFDEDARFQQATEALTLADVAAQAKATLAADVPRTVLVVGDGAAIRSELEAIVKDGLLGVDRLVELDPDGRPRP